MKTYFKAPWGTGLKCFSLATTLVLGPMCVASITLLHTEWSNLPALFFGSLPCFILGSAVCYVVRGYTLEAGTLRIHRLFWDTVIPLAGLRIAEVVPHAMHGSVRICGNGGLYSFTGHFWNKRLGHYRAYVNDWKRPVVLCFTTRNTIVLSTDDPEGFVEVVKAQTTPP